MKRFEIRDPIHGFISFDEKERQLIDHPCFQRLRRITQLAWTHMVYPGAMHTRFEHSLGVMHLATKMFDSIVSKDWNKKILGAIGKSENDLSRDRTVVRLAGLLHDLGHAPFSHASEELYPVRPDGKHYKHEDYSVKIIELKMKELIDGLYRDEGITTDDICGLINGKKTGKSLIWKNLISSQLDADRSDYLMRDSYHLGVKYGFFDLERLLNCITLINEESSGNVMIGLEFGGFHSAESIIIARYMMFTQVYFQHTRRSYDILAGEMLKEILSEKKEMTFPGPEDPENLERFLDLDDWKILGMIRDGHGGEPSRKILERSHYKRVYETVEYAERQDLDLFSEIVEKFKDNSGIVDNTKNLLYKSMDNEILILNNIDNRTIHLSRLSSVVRNLNPVNQYRIYSALSDEKAIKELRSQILDFAENKKKLWGKYT